MPVITFLQDLYSLTKNRRYRLLTRHTQRVCSTIKLQTKNEFAHKFLALAAVAADEYLACHIGDGNNVNAKNVPAALRVYLSGLLLLLGGRKEELLSRVGIDEIKFIQLWCKVFNYKPDDMKKFDQLRTVCEKGIVDDMIQRAGELIFALLFEEERPFGAGDFSLLAENMEKDLKAIARLLAQGGESHVQNR